MSLLVRRRGKGEVNDGFVDYRNATLDWGYCTDIKIYRMFAKTLYLMGFLYAVCRLGPSAGEVNVGFVDLGIFWG